MKNNKETQTKSQRSYQRWKLVNIRPETKAKLETICEALSTPLAKVKQVDMLDFLINEKFKTL